MDRNIMCITNIVRQRGKVYNFPKRLHYLYLPCILIPLFVEIFVKHHANYITYLSMQCGNTCLPDFCNLCDIVNVGWKRKYIDRPTKRFNICTKPTLFSAQMNGQ